MTWQILGVHNSVNGQFRVIARSGSRVIHADRLTQEGVDAFDPQAYWDLNYVKPAPNLANAVTIGNI